MMVWTQLDAVRKEIEIMRQIQHENCVRLIEVIEDAPKYDENGDQISDDDASEKLYLVMELAEHR